VALAHHREDLLETRLIRLIRGAGPQGLEAMSVQDDWKLRPLLSLSRRQLEDYARVRGLQWVEDPSNRNSDHLRNWLRAEWLPSLENQRPGAGRALARSLQELCTSGKDRALGQELGNFVGLRRDSLKHVNAHQRRALIARYFLALGVRNYGQTHIDEVVKRLSTRAKTSRFELLGFNWEITQDLLWASRV
jgi:tRNA(Ile)-lysidine synthase